MSRERQEITRTREETVFTCDGCGAEIDPEGDRLMLVELKKDDGPFRIWRESFPTGLDFHSSLCLRAYLSTEESRVKPSEHVKATLDRLLTQGLNPRAVEIAYQHAEEWVAASPPPSSVRSEPSADELDDAPTFNPVTAEEAQEIRRVNMLAARGLTEIPRLAKLLDDTARALHDYTQRLTALNTADLARLGNEPEPGCRSCARTERRGQSSIGGHFAVVYDRVPDKGLCRWCWDYERVQKELPPVEACDLYHRQSPRAAGLYLAKHGKAA